MNVGENTALGDGDVSQQLVQLLIVADGELKVTRDDTGLLVVASGVASQLQNLGSEVLEDSSQVDRSTSTDTLGIVALAEQTVNTADGESQTSLGRAAIEREASVELFEELMPGDATRQMTSESRLCGDNSRLRALGAAGLAAGLATSHFDEVFGDGESGMRM